jgi:hypothetical protein
MTEAEWLACDDPRELILSGLPARKLRLFTAACCRRILERTDLVTDPRSLAVPGFIERVTDMESGDGEWAAACWAEWSAAWRQAADAVQDIKRRSDYRRTPELVAAEIMDHALGSLGSDAAATETAEFVCYSTAYLLTGDEDEESPASRKELRALADLIREIAGNKVRLLPKEYGGNPARQIVFQPVWRTPTVIALAEMAYTNCAFDRLPILPDAADFRKCLRWASEDAFECLPVLADALEDAGCTEAAILEHCRGPGPHVRGCWVVDLILGKQ